MVEVSYLLYLVIAIGLTIWVARTLSKNGLIFLVQCFGQNDALARSTNHLLVVGFYLINLGFIALSLSASGEPQSTTAAIRFLGAKVGWAVLVLGAMHFFNMAMIARFGRKVNELLNEQRGHALAS